MKKLRLMVFLLVNFFICILFLFLYKHSNDIKASSFKFDNSVLDSNYVKGEAIIVFKKDTLIAKNFLSNMLASVVDDSEINLDTDVIQNLQNKINDKNAEIKISLPPALISSFDGQTYLQSTSMNQTGIVAHIKSEEKTTADILQSLDEDPQILYAQPNYLYKLDEIDTSDYTLSADIGDRENANDLWGVFTNSLDAGISAPAAWGQGFKGKDVVVAVIDSGVDIRHNDIVNNIWSSPTETDCSNRIDDDGNGYIDDCVGYDFGDDDSDPTPSPIQPSGQLQRDAWLHGTHVAGTIAAISNGFGVVGVAPEAKIMVLKVTRDGSDGSIDGSKITEAINYAINNGADVVNMSLGQSLSNSDDKIMQNTLQSTTDTRSFFVAAAGNQGANDINYPASEANVLAVGASNYEKKRSSFSNYGLALDVVAPGGSQGGDSYKDTNDILSLSPNNEYIYMEGTSMATPHVSGSIALLLSKDPTLTNQQIFDAVRNTASDILPEGKDDKTGYGLIDIETALTYLDDNSCTGNTYIIGLNTKFGENEDGLSNMYIQVTSSTQLSELIETINKKIGTIPENACGKFVAGFDYGAMLALHMGLLGQNYYSSRILDGIIHINNNYLESDLIELEQFWSKTNYQKVPIMLLHDTKIDNSDEKNIGNLKNLLEDHGYVKGENYVDFKLYEGSKVDFINTHKDYTSDIDKIKDWMKKMHKLQGSSSGVAGDSTGQIANVDSRKNTLKVEKFSNKNSAFTGEDVSYAIKCSNIGTLDYENVVLIDDYDEKNVDIVNVPQGCADDGDKFTCKIGILSAGSACQCSHIVYTAKIKGKKPQEYVVLSNETNGVISEYYYQPIDKPPNTVSGPWPPKCN